MPRWQLQFPHEWQRSNQRQEVNKNTKRCLREVKDWSIDADPLHGSVGNIPRCTNWSAAKDIDEDGSHRVASRKRSERVYDDTENTGWEDTKVEE